MDLIWYAAYGSNLSQDRLMHYLVGGQPTSAKRSYAGARDPSRPRATKSLLLPGEVYFAWQSVTWGGGVAFYDPITPGASAGRAYLITASQFADMQRKRCTDRLGLISTWHRSATGSPR